MTLVDFRAFPACLALPEDMLIFDHEDGFRVPAFSAQDKLVDEHIEKVLEFILIVGPVDNVTLRWPVADNFRLGTKLKAEELSDVDGRTAEIVGDLQDIGDYCFDAVTFSFNLRDEN